MNGLEALEKIFEDYGLADNFSGHFIRTSTQEEMLEPIKKELKALEVIKKKSTLDFDYIRNADNYDDYLKHFGKVIQEMLVNNESVHFAVNKDEFDLLKEVLK